MNRTRTPGSSVLALLCASLLCACETSSSVASASVAPEVELLIERVTDSDWNASLVNHGAEPVIVVLPGDGSAAGWRTPIVRWTVVGEEGDVPDRSGGRCGHLNALQSDEVVTLMPGAAVSLDRYGMPRPRLPRSGATQVSLTYENVPRMKWKHWTLGRHDSRALRRLRKSTPLSLRSNVVRFERSPIAPDGESPRLAPQRP